MRFDKTLLVYSVLIFTVFADVNAVEEKPLAEIYKSGSVNFVPVQTIGKNTMPKSVFFEGAVSIATDEDEQVYICDYKANNIKKFDNTGKFLKAIGRAGQGPGEFNMPFNIVVTTDKLIVYDMGNWRLCSLTLDGDFIKSVGLFMDQGRLQKMRAFPDGNIAIALEKAYFGESEKPQDYLISIFSAELENAGSVYSQQIWRNKYLRLKGVTTNVIQPFSPLVYWGVSPDGKIVVGKSDKYEIHICSIEGEKIHSFSHSYKPIKITSQDKEVFFSNVAYSTGGAPKRGAPDHVKKNTDFPKHKPAFRQIQADSEGNILVCVYREKREEDLKYFDAFDPEGKFLGSVRIKGDVPFPLRAKIKNRYFWIIQADDDGNIKIVKYKICE